MIVVVLFAFALWGATAFAPSVPTFALDGSWATGVDWGVLAGKQFGRDIDFTYGPLAELDLSSYLSLRLLLPAAIVALVTGVVFVFLAWHLLRGWLPSVPVALLLVLVVVPVWTTVQGFSAQSLAISVMCAIGLATGRIPQRWRLAILIVLSICAGAAILTKFSNGTLTAGTVLLIAMLCSDRSVARRALEFAASLCGIGAALVVFWLASGQKLGYLGAWLNASVQLTSGYPEAMATEDGHVVITYVALLVTLGLLVLAVWLGRSGSRVVLTLLLAWVAIVALKVGFTRHDDNHVLESFLLVLVAAMGVGIARRFYLGLLAAIISAAVAIVASPLSYPYLVNPERILAANETAAQAIFSPEYRSDQLAAARAVGRSTYRVSRAVLRAVGHKTVDIDPWDSNVALAYKLAWDPVPVFQTYSAYTTGLDQINATSITSPRGPQVVLRGTLRAIDTRNPMWESPLYMQALICDFVPTTTSDNWLVLDKSANRCGKEVPLETHRFSPGQRVAVPDAPAGDLVVAHFSLQNTPLNEVATALFKPISEVTVSTNVGSFRLPRAHEGGPLIVRMSKSVGWATQFGGSTKNTDLTLNVSGSVTFSAIPVAAGR